MVYVNEAYPTYALYPFSARGDGCYYQVWRWVFYFGIDSLSHSLPNLKLWDGLVQKGSRIPSLFVIIVITHCLTSLATVCVLEHRPLLSSLLYNWTIWKGRKAGERVKVEITNTLHAEKDHHPQLSLVDFQATQGSFKQPTEAEISMLTSCKLRYARSHAQELSNEFARLLNRGSSLE